MDRRVVAAVAVVGVDAPHYDREVVGGEADGGLEVRLGAGVLAFLKIDLGPRHQRRHALGVQHQRLAEVLQRLVDLAVQQIADAAVVAILGLARIELDRPVEVGDRPAVVALVQIADAAGGEAGRIDRRLR